ncbi:hypothetical protein H1R20_g7336, partial [Candolleomyces eurysporus]
MALALNVVSYRNSQMPGRQHWTLIVMHTATHGTEFKLTGTSGKLTFTKPGTNGGSTNPTLDDGFKSMASVGKIETRKYAAFCSIVESTAILNGQPQWTTLDWVVTILNSLAENGFSVARVSKDDLEKEAARQLRVGRRGET